MEDHVPSERTKTFSVENHQPMPGKQVGAVPPLRPAKSGATSSAAESIGQGPTRPSSDHIEIIRPLWASPHVLTLEAWDYSLQRAVMIRTLTPEASRDPVVAEEFWRQARQQARLHHDRILSVLFVDKATGWVVTEFCGQRLSDELSERGLAADRLVMVMQQTLEGLVYLHGQGQLHGALQPSMVLMDAEGSVKLDGPSGRSPGSELSLPRGLKKYAAPEFHDEHKFGSVEYAADIYALGISALELMAGKRFLEFFRDYELDFDEDEDAWLRWHLSTDARVPPINSVLPKVPAELAGIVDRMLDKRVRFRPTAAAALAALTGTTVPTTRLLTVGPPRQRPVELPAVRSVEPIALLTAAEKPDLYAVGPAAPVNRVGVRGWFERLQAEGNSSYLAAGMVLVAAIVAGVSLVGSSPRTESALTSAGSDDSLLPPIAATNEYIEPATSPIAAVPTLPVPPAPPPPLPVVAQPVSTVKAPPEAGRIVVVVHPTNAWVQLTGTRQRDRLNMPVPAGTYLVEAGKWDCLPKEQSVRVEPGQTVSLSVDLEPRPTIASYEPVPFVASKHAAVADELVTALLDTLWSGDRSHGSVLNIERRLREGVEGSDDPRVLHALALLMVGPKKDSRRATPWYERAVRHSPVYYCWPYKGLVKCQLVEGRTSEALRVSEDFLQRATALAAQYPSNPKANDFLNDAACFVGHAIGLVESESPHRGAQALLTRKLTNSLPRSAAEVLQAAIEENVARYQETVATRADSQLVVWQFLGDSIASERRALLASVACNGKQGRDSAYASHMEVTVASGHNAAHPLQTFTKVGEAGLVIAAGQTGN